ncbi:Fic family protein [Magnetospirillum sp. 64-120]|uniref:Fic family protein n=1 Tax=Magnetospirillum sp. 64-120 TaxID=1895778 RepID=UPI00092768F1|nr:Fic family protein [Magnetospirillum sp. 64-120]OJX77432.1 MAG: hypothetical protein BGO92_10395 [Magnetospirillum sp. 64-120]
MADEQSIQNPIQDDGGLDDIEEKIVDLLRHSLPGYTARDLLAALAREGHAISQPTLSRRLTKLQAARHVVARKAGRSTYYERDPYHDWFRLPPNQRGTVGYKFEFLSGYRPNIDRWISAEESALLLKAGGGRRLEASTYSRAIAQKLLVDLAYASSALEGNTYTYLDTKVLIEYGQAAEGKALDETVMILNHKEAITYLIDNIDDIEVNVREIKTLHALLSRGLSNMDPREVGVIRRTPVDGIDGSAYLPMAIPQKLEEELEQIALKAAEIRDPFEQSLFLMAFISYLQAFRDVNKRTGRLACNIPLLKNGLAPLSFMDVDKRKYVKGLLGVYELNRTDILKDAYIEGYVKSAKRYDAYAARDRSVVELEFRRRVDIYACVAALVKASAEKGERIDPAEFAVSYFSGDEEDVRLQLSERVSEIVQSLDVGNHVAYGITHKAFDEYAKLPQSPQATLGQ